MSDKILNNELNHDYQWKIGYNFKTDVSQSIGGNEQRRARWEAPLRKYTLPFNNKYLTSLKKIIQFFYEHKGQYDSFYFYDPTSRFAWTITNEYKIGDPVTQIHLPFRPVINATVKPLTLLVSNDISLFNVTVRVNNVIKPNVKMEIDPILGLINFIANAPLRSDTITVEFDHLVRVRFANDLAEFTESTYNVGSCSVELVEVR